MPGLQKIVSTHQSVTDEQARHQDLLTVAIETLSDQSHFIAGMPKVTSNTPTGDSQESGNIEASAESTKDITYQNGKIESKIVTLNAGTVSNEFGGQTSVYTVALDPSSIKKPLLMPRVLRKKSEKEKQAEKAAKMYRKKKAELLNRQTMVKPVNEPDDSSGESVPHAVTNEAAVSPIKSRRMPRILLRSSSPKGKGHQPDKLQHILIHRSQDGSVTTTKVSGSSSVEQTHAELLNKEEFGQVVNFDSDNEEDNIVDVLGLDEDSNRNNLDAGKRGDLKGKTISLITGKKSNDTIDAEESCDIDTKRKKLDRSTAGNDDNLIMSDKDRSGAAGSLARIEGSGDEHRDTHDKSGDVGTSNVSEELDKIEADISTDTQSTHTSTVNVTLDEFIQKNVQPSFDNTETIKVKNEEGSCSKQKEKPCLKQKEDSSKAATEVGSTTSSKSCNRGDHEQYTLTERYMYIAENLRSSATKRKGKVPRRLPMTAEETQNLKKATVKLRKNSRCEKNDNCSKTSRVTRSRSVHAEDAELDRSSIKISAEIKNIDKAQEITTDGNTETTPVDEKMTMDKRKPQLIIKLERISGAQTEKDSVSDNENNSNVSKIQIESVHGHASEYNDMSRDVVHIESANDTLDTGFDESNEDLEEITLDRTVDNVENMNTETNSVKRKHDGGTVELPVKRVKRARSSSAGGKDDNDQADVTCESPDNPRDVLVCRNVTGRSAVKVKTEQVSPRDSF